MVNANAEADKSHQAPTQQRTSTPKMFNRNVIILNCDMDSHLSDVAKGPRLRAAQG